MALGAGVGDKGVSMVRKYVIVVFLTALAGMQAQWMMLPDSVHTLSQFAALLPKVEGEMPAGAVLVMVVHQRGCVGCYSTAVQGITTALAPRLPIRLLLIHSALSRQERAMLTTYYLQRVKDSQNVRVYWSKNPDWSDIVDTVMNFMLYRSPAMQPVQRWESLLAFVQWVRQVFAQKKLQVVRWDTLQSESFLAYTDAAVDRDGRFLWIKEFLPRPQWRIYAFSDLRLSKTMLRTDSAFSAAVRSRFALPLLHTGEQWILNNVIAAPSIDGLAFLLLQRYQDEQQFLQRGYYLLCDANGEPQAISRPFTKLPSSREVLAADSVIWGFSAARPEALCRGDTIVPDAPAIVGLHWRDSTKDVAIPLRTWLDRKRCGDTVSLFLYSYKCLAVLGQRLLFFNALTYETAWWDLAHHRKEAFTHPFILQVHERLAQDPNAYAVGLLRPAPWGAAFAAIDQAKRELSVLAFHQDGSMETWQVALPVRDPEAAFADLSYLNTVDNVHYFLVKVRTPERFHWVVFGIAEKENGGGREE